MNEKTADNFVSLYKHGIGVKCAIFYVAWAELFTMTDSFKKAAQVYKKGIDRLAEPIEMLKDAERFLKKWPWLNHVFFYNKKNSFRNFQAFLVRKMLDSKETFTPMSEFYETETTRQAYNKLKPINMGNKEIVPSKRTGDNIVSGPGKYKIAAQPVAKSNVGIAIYQVRIFAKSSFVIKHLSFLGPLPAIPPSSPLQLTNLILLFFFITLFTVTILICILF